MDQPVEPIRPKTLNAFSIFLLALVFLLWLALMANLMTIHGNDPAGRGLAQAYAVATAIALWIVLGVFFALVAVKTRVSLPIAVMAGILILSSGVASLASIDLASAGPGWTVRWVVAVPGLSPLLIVSYAFWLSGPSSSGSFSARTASLAVWGAVFLLSASPWPMLSKRSRERKALYAQQEAAHQATETKQKENERLQRLSKFEKLPDDAPLWEWRDFTDHEKDLRERALERIRRLDRRQSDAETMLKNGLSFVMTELPNLDLRPTPAICENARKFLGQQAEFLRPKSPQPRPYSEVSHWIEIYLPGMQWLVERGCDCNAELKAIEESVGSYPDAEDRNRFLNALARLRKTS